MGFFAVFKLNKETGFFEFVDRWLNSRADEKWIERTITAMGWSPMEVQVNFYYAPDASIYGFNEELTLIKYKKVKAIGPDSQEIDTLEIDETFIPQVWYKEGTLLKTYG